MISTFLEGFGSDSFMREMKRLWRKNPDAAASLLMDQLRPICRAVIRKEKNGFYGVTKEDFEDYAQEAWIKLWENMDGFLSDPRNDPDSAGDHYSASQRYSWAYTGVLHEMQHMRDRKLGKVPAGTGSRRISPISLNTPVGEDGDGTEFGDRLPEPGLTPEERMIRSSNLREALEQLLSLPNAAETLAAVGYVIMSSELDEKRSAEEYAVFLNGHTIREITDCMEDMLNIYEIDVSCLRAFRERIGQEGTGEIIPVITSKKLVNRKNDIRTSMREVKERMRILEEKGK